MEVLAIAVMFFIATEVGAVLVWDDAAFAWVLIFYPAAFLLAIGLGEQYRENPLVTATAIAYIAVSLTGFLLGSVWAAWLTKKLR